MATLLHEESPVFYDPPFFAHEYRDTSWSIALDEFWVFCAQKKPLTDFCAILAGMLL
jgi:hypothetical protein